jgi:hypothetical protein
MINVKRLLNTPMGRFFISLILGLGLATFFRKVCKDKNCIVFNGPIISEFDNKIYKYGNKCYKYNTTQDNCDNKKRIIDISMDDKANEKKTSSMNLLGLGGK